MLPIGDSSSAIWLYNFITMLKLKAEQARSFTLARQFLRLPAPDPMGVVRRLTVIQAQYAAAVPVAIFSRCPQAAAGWVDEAWLEKRRLVKTWTLRSTLHLLAVEDLPLLVQALGSIYEEEFIRFLARRRGVDRTGYERANAAILDALAAGPLSRSELHAVVPFLQSIGAVGWGVDVKGLAFQGKIVVAGSRGREPLFALRSAWQPEGNGAAILSELAAQQELLRRYLTAFGPAAVRDFAHWSGITVRQAQAIFQACKDELLRLEVQGWPGEQYILAHDEAELRNASEIPAVCLLPKFDAVLIGYARSPRFVRPEDYKQVYGAAGQIEAVALVDGEVAASWRIERRGKQAQFKLTLLTPGSGIQVEGLTPEFEQLGAFLGFDDVIVRII